MEQSFWFQNLIHRLKSRFFILGGIIIISCAVVYATDALGKLKTWVSSEIGVAENNFQLAAVIELRKTPEQRDEKQNIIITSPTPKKIETKVLQKNDEHASSTNSINTPVVSEIKTCSFLTDQNASRQLVILNEVAWMGSMLSANDEWIELKNISDDTISLRGWQLKDKGEQISVLFDASFSIEPKGFILLERTDDNSVPAIAADIIYVGALSNSNEGLHLFDSECHLIDEVIAASDWPAGNPGERRTMERHANLNWYTYTGNGANGIMGTPLAENSVPLIATSSNPSGVPINGSSAIIETAPTSTPSVPAALPMISEIQIAGATVNDEFVELYNPTDNAIVMTDWSLKRKSPAGKEYNLVVKSGLEGKSIPPHGYLLLANEEGYGGSVTPDVQWAKSNTIASNNTVLLYAPDGSVADKVGFGTAQDFEGTAALNPESGKSLARPGNIDSNDNGKDFIVSTPTPKAAN